MEVRVVGRETNVEFIVQVTSVWISLNVWIVLTVLWYLILKFFKLYMGPLFFNTKNVRDSDALMLMVSIMSVLPLDSLIEWPFFLTKQALIVLEITQHELNSSQLLLFHNTLR